MNPYEKEIAPEVKQHLFTHAGESWQDAVKRLERLCHADIEAFEDDDGNTVVVNLSEQYNAGEIFAVTRKEPIDRIRAYERDFGVSVPSDLIALMCDHGAFRIDATNGWRTTLSIYDATDVAFPNIKPYAVALSFNFTGATPGVADLTNEQRNFLNANYFFFGYLYEGDGDIDYLYFTKNGNFGAMRYEEEFISSTMQNAIAPMLENQTEKHTLDSLLASKIDRTIRILLERNEIVQSDEIIV